MSRVGDLIISMRELGPDLPAPLPAPTGLGFSAVSAPGSTLPTGDNYVEATLVNPWGETLPGTEAKVTLAANQGIRVTGTFPSNVLELRIYHGTSSGGESEYFSLTVLPTTIDGSGAVAGAPPTENTAWNPDADGSFVAASTCYRWLSEALDKAGLTTRGIRDVGGVRMVNGQGVYALLGRWLRITNAWYDGWLMTRGGRENFFYHNTATGISWILDVSRVGPSGLTLEVWPQPTRTGCATTLAGALGAAEETASIADSTNFLPLGLVKIGTEVCYYMSASGNQLTGLVRGVAGTTPQAWAIGTAVVELNLRLAGRRLPSKPSLGDGYDTLDVPYGWDSILSTYMLYKYREAEQDGRESDRLLKQFYAELKELAVSNRQISGPVQIGGRAREVWGGGLGGGWFIP